MVTPLEKNWRSFGGYILIKKEVNVMHLFCQGIIIVTGARGYLGKTGFSKAYRVFPPLAGSDVGNAIPRCAALKASKFEK